MKFKIINTEKKKVLVTTQSIKSLGVYHIYNKSIFTS